MAWITQHKLVFALIIAVVAGGIWLGLSQSQEPAPLLTTTSAPDASTGAIGGGDQEIIGTLLSLRAVTLSGSIFEEPAFLTLQDFGTTIVLEPVGRENPFAPLGAQAAGAAAPAGPRDAEIFSPRR